MTHWGDRAYDVVNVLLTRVNDNIDNRSVKGVVYDHLSKPLYDQLRQVRVFREAREQFLAENH